MFVYINRDPQNQNWDLSTDDSIVGMTLEEQWYDD